MFWDEHDIDWIELNSDFELIVKNLQAITHDFIINIANNIDSISMSQIDDEIIDFIKKYDHYLMRITQTYSWILDLQPITNTEKGEYEKCN
ncbi:MAG: hypothetical protein L3J71_17775 [Victivallaceae bacterium]|nr:hypothetical protein [Victivallaceae bacterium]